MSKNNLDKHFIDKLNDSNLDLFIQINAQLTLKDAENSPGRHGKDVSVPKFENRTLEKVEVVAPFLYIPTEDENNSGDEKDKLFAQTVAWGLEHLPVKDIDSDWESREVAIGAAYEYFGENVPKVTVDWQEPASDAALTRIAFQGIGAHRLERTDYPDIGAAYMIDLLWMNAYPVRDTFDRYGSIAYFDSDFKPVGIYDPRPDKIVKPGDDYWESAKWRFRTTLFAAVTLNDHLGTTHYLYSNTLSTATLELLPTSHPLRNLLTPFIFGANEINEAAVLTLSNKGGNAHRIWAMEYDGVVRCVLDGVLKPQFETFEESLVRRGVDNLGSDYPYGEDGRKFVKILEQLAEEFIDVYYDGDEVAQDADIQAWWAGLTALSPNLRLGLLRSKSDLVRVLSHFMFIVTGYHRQVGDISPYTLDPAFTGTKLRDADSQTIGDMQSTTQMVTLTISTGKVQPKMIDDFTHVMPEHKNKEAVEVFERYQGRLKDLSKQVEKANKHRGQEFETFNPIHSTSSVST